MSESNIESSKAGGDSGLCIQLRGGQTPVIHPETKNSSGGLGWRKRAVDALDPRGWEDFTGTGEATISRGGPVLVPSKYPEYQWGVDGNPFEWIKQASAQIREAQSRERISRLPIFVKIKENE